MVLVPLVGSGTPGVTLFGCWNLVVLESFGVLEPGGGSGIFRAKKSSNNDIHFCNLNGRKTKINNTKTKM